MTLTSNLHFGSYIEATAQRAAKKLGILSKVRRYITPERLLTLYQAQVRSKYQLEALKAIERRARRLIGDDRLFDGRLQSLNHLVTLFSIVYRVKYSRDIRASVVQ